MSMISYPEEDGAFPHMSGVTFSVNKSIPSSVQVDENGFFTKVTGDYRVYNVKVYDKESGTYKDLELDKKYNFASSDYYILSYGSGMSMFKDAKVIESEGMLDVEVLERYITDNLNGVIGDEYKNVVNRITFTDGYIDVKAEDKTVTRADAVIALWMMEGSPVANYAMRFNDVTAETAYTEAIRWAAAVKIVNGYSEGSFAPNDILTREQLATILWRYAKYKKADVSVGENTKILSYDDAFEISEYAIPAFQWTCASGVMSGNTVSTLAPKNAVTENLLSNVLSEYSEKVKS